jgi:hypothetical protein
LALQLEIEFEANDAARHLGDKVQAALVINEVDGCPIDPLLCVRLLLFLENVLNEKLLQSFVGVFDAKRIVTFSHSSRGEESGAKESGKKRKKKEKKIEFFLRHQDKK